MTLLDIFIPENPGENVPPRTRIKRAITSVANAVPPRPLEGPISLAITLVTTRPKSHYRANGSLKPGAPLYPSTATNPAAIAATVRKALLGPIFESPRQIVDLITAKRFGDEIGIRIRVTSS